MPEVTENYIRIPNPKHAGCASKNLRTIDISPNKGIKALYCIDHRKIKTYLFDKEKWTQSEAQAWVDEHAKDVDHFINKQWAKGYVEKLIKKGDEDKLGLCVISSGTVDRDGDMLDPSGWVFNNFKKNPVMLWSHNAGVGERRPPIGKIEDVQVKDGKVYFTPKFDLKDPFAKEIHRKYKEGFLNAFSVGFLPLEWEETETGYHFKKQEALEFSAVNVPANPEALVILREEGFKVSKSFKDWKKTKKRTEKGAIPYKKYPLAPEDATWDAGAEVKKAEIEDLKLMCAWFDSSKPDVKASYKLPHHKAGNKYTVWNGVRAAMAALFGARGGVDIPSADRKKVYNHLAKHYREFDRKPPEFKHFEAAIWKVARGKKIEKKSNISKMKKSERDELVALLKKVGRVLEGQSPNINGKSEGGDKR